MDQRSFDFSNEESNSFYLLLDRDHQQSVTDLMAALIIHVFHEQENKCHDQFQHSNQDQS